MRVSIAKPGGIAVALAILATHDSVAQQPVQEIGHPTWYIAVGAGSNRTEVLEQAGFNRDDICYPTNFCPGTPDGYRWFYDLEPDSGAMLDLAIGRSLDFLRLEVSASAMNSGVQETFTAINYFDGTPVRPAEDDNYGYSDETAVDRLSTRVLAFNIYRDFAGAAAGIQPYVGIGAGVAQVELSGLHFSSNYSCIREPCTGRPAAEYNSRRTTDIAGTVWSGNLYAGIDYPLPGNGWVLGLKAAYRAVGDIEGESGYQQHPIPDQIATERISGMDHLSLTLGIRFGLGRGAD